jgi:hypothetical protein
MMFGIFRRSARLHTIPSRFSGTELTAHFTILAEEPLPHRKRNILVDRAGVRLLFTHPEFREEIENDAGLNFQFPGQLIYSNFLHRGNC